MVLRLPYAPAAAVLRLLQAPAAAVPEEPPDLSAWRQNEKEEGGTGVTPVLKGILQEISDDDSEVL